MHLGRGTPACRGEPSERSASGLECVRAPREMARGCSSSRTVEVFEIGENFVLGLGRDEMDVERVQLLHLSRR
jgi:hypothetical protein